MDKLSKVNPTDEHKKKRYNWNYINKAIDDLAVRIKKNNYIAIYGLPRGGLIPAVMLSHKLNLPLINNKSFVTSKILVVDDIIDSGNTIKEFKKLHGNFDLVTIHYKNCSTIYPTYYYEKIDKRVWAIYPWE